MPDQFDGVKISSFPDASEISNSDRLTGLKSGANTNFTFATIMGWIRDSIQAFFIPNSAKGSANGVASLDSNGKVPGTQLDLSGKQSTITANGILKGDGAGGVSAATAGTDYQAPLTFDATPTANSTNPVQSGGVYTDVRTRVPVYGMGENLLDNSDFAHPVNQRGQSSYAGSLVYGINRWRTGQTSGSKMEIDSGVVTVSETESNYGGINQILRKDALLGKTVTLSVLYKRKSGGIFNFGLRQGTINSIGSAIGNPGTLPGDIGAVNLAYITIAIPSNISASYYITCAFYANNRASSVDIIRAKLELGTEQTLCHNEGTTESPVWVLNEVPDYEYELFRCMTSTADSSDTYANKSLATEQQLAYVETGTTTSRAYSAGKYFCWNGLLYRVTTAISGGGTITPGSNCEQVTVGSILTGTSVSTSAIGMPGIAVSRVRAGIVFLNVYDFKPSSASGTISGTLPQELRPIQTTSGMVLSADGTKYARISISTQGVVTYTGVDTREYHYGLISYPAAI